jgi:hypothetical protein
MSATIVPVPMLLPAPNDDSHADVVRALLAERDLRLDSRRPSSASTEPDRVRPVHLGDQDLGASAFACAM